MPRPFQDSPWVWGVSLSVGSGETALERATSFHSVLLKAGSRLNEQHIVAQVPSCRNPLRKTCGFPHAGSYRTLPNPFTFQVQGKPQRWPFEIRIREVAAFHCRVPLPERAGVSRGQLCQSQLLRAGVNCCCSLRGNTVTTESFQTLKASGQYSK